jgi:hypothetical protein
LVNARNANRAGLRACVERGISSGELPKTVIPEVLATAFDSFLLGLSTLARDGVTGATLDAAVDQMMGLWDSLSTGHDT